MSILRGMIRIDLEDIPRVPFIVCVAFQSQARGRNCVWKRFVVIVRVISGYLSL